MKTDKEIKIRKKELKILREKEEKMLKEMPGIAFQMGQVSYDKRDRYANEIITLEWVIK